MAFGGAENRLGAEIECLLHPVTYIDALLCMHVSHASVYSAVHASQLCLQEGLAWKQG